MSSVRNHKTDYQVGPSKQEAKLISEARLYIADGETSAALGHIQRVLRMNKQNTDALWMFANITEEPEKAKLALRRLLAVDPFHEKANNLLKKLEAPTNDLFWEPDRGNNSHYGHLAKYRQPGPLEQQSPYQQPMYQQTVFQPIMNTMPMGGINQTVIIEAGPRPRTNGFALGVGFLVGALFSLFGVAHLLNGKLVSALLYCAIGWGIWLPLMIAISMTGPAMYVALLVHVIVAFAQAKNGAVTVYHGGVVI